MAGIGTLLLGLILLCGCKPAGGAGASAAVAAQAPVAVKAVAPSRGEIARSVTLPSFRILAYQEATLYAKVSGYLKNVTFDKGDVVKEGQLLAEIEVPELLADQAQYEAETKVARGNYARMEEARKKAPDLVVPQNVDDLRGQWEVAQAKLQRTKTLLQYAKLSAPFAGTITARYVDPGAFIPAATSGTPGQSGALATLMDCSRIRAQVYVPEAEVPFVKAGAPVKLTVEELPARSFTGAVTRCAYALDQTTKTMLTEIELANPNGELRPGMYASVQIELERKQNALVLPVAAVAVEKTGSSVFALTDGKVKKTPVRTGFNDGMRVEIVEGIKPDQPVAVAKQALSDGQAVNVTEGK